MCLKLLLIVVVACFVHVTKQQIRFVDDDPPAPPAPQQRTPSNNSSSNDPYYLGIQTFSELPPNITIPKPESQVVISEMNEPDRNRSSILQWILGLTGLGPKPGTEEQAPPEKCGPCMCGKTNQLNRIVGGQETQVNEYPWMTLLKYGSRFYCGAALISDKYLLTAAHCVTGFDVKRITAYLLEHDRTRPDETKTIKRRVIKATKHPHYSPRNYDNDIAILKLNASVPMDGNLRPVCLAPPGETYAGKDGVVTGWGAINEGGPLATKLQEVVVPIISNDDCKKTSYGPNRITGNMMCAGFQEGKKDSCQGDSGGPLHVAVDNTYYEVGVVSWGQGCAEPDFPGVYTRVNHYRDWISNQTRDACFC